MSSNAGTNMVGRIFEPVATRKIPFKSASSAMVSFGSKSPAKECQYLRQNGTNHTVSSYYRLLTLGKRDTSSAWFEKRNAFDGGINRGSLPQQTNDLLLPSRRDIGRTRC